MTPRQLEVLELMAKGLTNREIGRVLGISPGTAKVHVSAVLEALDVTNRTEAATRLHELGLGAGTEETRDEFTVAGFGARPAVAVLPFDSFSSDPEQEFLADGIVEDLTTRLACWRWLPVIARNSTFVGFRRKWCDSGGSRPWLSATRRPGAPTWRGGRSARSSPGRTA